MGAAIDPAIAAELLAGWGFLADPDLPAHPGPAHLLVAIRDRPTLHHFDPELIEFWTTVRDRGVRQTLNGLSPMPLETSFSWGAIRIVDRLRVSNEYLTFGGHLSAASIGGAVIAVFTSPAPLLRRGGHSQGWDPAAENLGAFFGRLKIAVDYAPGFEARVGRAEPVARFSCFLADLAHRYGASPELRATDPGLWQLIQSEEARLRREHRHAWADGLELLAAAGAG